MTQREEVLYLLYKLLLKTYIVVWYNVIFILQSSQTARGLPVGVFSYLHNVQANKDICLIVNEADKQVRVNGHTD